MSEQNHEENVLQKAQDVVDGLKEANPASVNNRKKIAQRNLEN